MGFAERVEWNVGGEADRGGACGSARGGRELDRPRGPGAEDGGRCSGIARWSLPFFNGLLGPPIQLNRRLRMNRPAIRTAPHGEHPGPEMNTGMSRIPDRAPPLAVPASVAADPVRAMMEAHRSGGIEPTNTTGSCRKRVSSEKLDRFRDALDPPDGSAAA